MTEKGEFNIKRLLFNFFSLPVFGAIAILIPLSLTLFEDHTNTSGDLNYSGLGDAFFVFYVGGFLLAVVILWWHYWMIREIIDWWGNKTMRYSNWAILGFPYVLALFIFAVHLLNNAILNHKIDATIQETTITEIDRTTEPLDIITYVNKGDSAYIVTGMGQKNWPDDANFLTILRIYSGRHIQNNYGRITYLPYQPIHLNSLRFLSCNNNLEPVDSLPKAFDGVYSNEGFNCVFKSLNINYNYRKDLVNEHYAIIKTDSIPYWVCGNFFEKSLFIIGDKGQKIDYYQPLKGFFQHDYANWVNYYDPADKSIYEVVNPQYSGNKANDCLHFLYLARYNKATVVYKVKFSWKEITSDNRFIDGFKHGDQFWLLTRKKLFKIALTP